MARLKPLVHTLAVLSSLGFSCVTRAASAEGATEAATPHDRSRALFQSGNEAFRAGDFELARQHYQSALQAERVFDIVCNLGRTEAELGDDKLALTHLDECLREYPPGEKVAAAREKFFHLRETVRERCKAKRCDARSVETTPTRAPDTEPEPKSELPEAGLTVPVEPESSARIPVTLTLAGIGAVGLGVGVGFLAASGAAETDARALRSEIVDDDGDCSGSGAHDLCPEFEGEIARANDFGNVGVTSLVAGGVIAAAAVATYFLWPDDASETVARRFLPVGGVAPDGRSGWLGVSGTF